MVFRWSSVVALAFVASTLAANFQKPGLVLPPSAAADRQAVKNAFTTAYNTYKQFAFGHDDLDPLSEGFNDGRNGWGATIFDAMSTMLVMDLTASVTSPPM